MAGELVAAGAAAVQTGGLPVHRSLWYIIGHDHGRLDPQHSNYPPGVSLSAISARTTPGSPFFEPPPYRSRNPLR
jgi:hypothetical protein